MFVGTTKSTVQKYREQVEELKKENAKLKEANDTFTLGARRTIESNCKLYKENQELNKISNVKTDLINELFSKMVQEADIDDGISISKEYGNRYLDEWNKIYEDIIKDTIKVMNECELDDDRVYLQFHACDCIEFCVKDTSEEEESGDESD